jgi:hypothetical protein
MIFISARQTPTPASDSPTASFQQPRAADPGRLRLLDEPKSTFAGFRRFRRIIPLQTGSGNEKSFCCKQNVIEASG